MLPFPSPFQPRPEVVPGEPGQDLLRRVLRIRATDDAIDRLVVLDRDLVRIALRDTGPEGTPEEVTGRDTALHVLWARDDDEAHLVVDGSRTPIAPGDTVVLPAGAAWQASGGLIACEITGPSSGVTDVMGPTHGEETFHGHNRQTTYPSPAGIAIERWKLTQALSIPVKDAPYALVDLARPMAMVWGGGTDLIGHGECRYAPEGCGPVTLIPNGLGYVLVVRMAVER